MAPGVLSALRRKKRFASIQEDFPWIWALQQEWPHTGQHFRNCEVAIVAGVDKVVDDVLNRLPAPDERLFIYHDTEMVSLLREIFPTKETTWGISLTTQWSNPDAPLLAIAVMGNIHGTTNRRLQIYVPRPEKCFPAWTFTGSGNLTRAS